MKIFDFFVSLFGKKTQPEKRPVNNNLKTCPWCSSNVAMIVNNGDDILTTFHCSNCGTCFLPPPHLQGNIRGMINWWNSRPTELQLSQEIKDLLKD